MRRRWARRAALATILVAASATLWHSRGESPASAAAPEAARPAAVRATPVDGAAAPTAVAAPAANPAPLPPHDTPLAAIADGLEARARAGDMRAACRLAAEAEFCLRHPPDDPMLEIAENVAALSPRTSANLVDAIADIEDERARAQRVCTGIADARLQDWSWSHSLQVALSGDAWFAVRYAMGRQLDRHTFLEHPVPWQLYRQHALPLLQRAAQQGEPRALWLLWRIHAGQDGLVGMPNAIARDPHLARVHALALRDISSGAMREDIEVWLEVTRDSASAEDWARAQAEGRELARTQYAATTGFDPRGGTIGTLEPARCDALSAP